MSAAEIDAAPDPMSRPWLEGRIEAEARELARIDRERQARRKVLALRARIAWDLERKLEVEILAADLAKKPALVVARLRCSRHGCDWLIARWRMLELATGPGSGSVDSKAKFAIVQDLLATPEAYRGDPLHVDPRHRGVPMAELIRSQIAELEALKAGGLDELDAMSREAAVEGLDVLGDKPLAALGRESAACQRRMQWALKRLEAEEKASRRRESEQVRVAEAPAEPAAAPPRESGNRQARRAELRQRLDTIAQRHLRRPTTPDEINVVRARLGLAPLARPSAESDSPGSLTGSGKQEEISRAAGSIC